MVGWLRKGVGELVRQAGLQLMELLMQEEVRELVGERSQRQAERTANRSLAICGTRQWLFTLREAREALPRRAPASV
jgi:hypothetical protein